MNLRVRSYWMGALAVVLLALARVGGAQVNRTEAKGIVLLVDVSGSMERRTGDWYETIQAVADGILGGTSEWRRNWRGLSGDSSVLVAVGADSPAKFAVVPFGLASPQAPYISVRLEGTVGRADRHRVYVGQFPVKGSFVHGKTFVNLAEAAAAKHMGDVGIAVGYLIVISDFEQDASGTPEQRELIAQFATNSLSLRQARSFSAQSVSNPGVEVRVIELSRNGMAQVTQPSDETSGNLPHKLPNDVPSGVALRLLRPGASATAGSITFAWTPVVNAVTYMLELRRTDSSAPSRQFVVSSVEKVVANIATGSYRWTVTARSSGLKQLGIESKPLKVQSPRNSPFGAIVLGLLFLVIAGGAVWMWRRRQSQATAS